MGLGSRESDSARRGGQPPLPAKNNLNRARLLKSAATSINPIGLLCITKLVQGVCGAASGHRSGPRLTAPSEATAEATGEAT